MMWSVWGSASWVACSRFAQHPSHVGGMHPQWTSVDRMFYHRSNLYLASACAPFYEDIAILIFLPGGTRSGWPAHLG